MHPENSIKVNKNIPLFVFDYFLQKDIDGFLSALVVSFIFNAAHGEHNISGKDFLILFFVETIIFIVLLLLFKYRNF